MILFGDSCTFNIMVNIIKMNSNIEENVHYFDLSILTEI